MSDIKADSKLDTSGKCCPMPIVETNVAMKKINSGEVLEIVATDPGTLTDIPSWCERTGHTLMESGEIDGGFQFYVKKG
ncbi:MAG: sulfurtransferase TusA family protein [Thiohalophilus sp.]|uniref:sulfurtransferase TusA family protein n=1 Tax=Thiohalophilus sp. TaxID=3028392 RepID=UPI00287089A4|nr:sulfurtransferase TusA family protein [Thiohalophilus sp.]MDR9435381.1 sulfurtransferase TusA family protein [Thiohalophilus sp.]